MNKLLLSSFAILLLTASSCSPCDGVCNCGKTCQYDDMWFLESPMLFQVTSFELIDQEIASYLASDFDYQAAQDDILLVIFWHDEFANMSCEGHCYTSGYYWYVIGRNETTAEFIGIGNSRQPPSDSEHEEILIGTKIVLPDTGYTYMICRLEDGITPENPPTLSLNSVLEFTGNTSPGVWGRTYIPLPME